MSGHTPGPWVLEENDDGHFIRMGTAVANRGWRPHQTHHVVDYDHMVAPEDGDGSQFKEAEANARLIAAAPELLEGLRRMVDADGSVSGTTFAEWVADARRAISKAEGNTP